MGGFAQGIFFHRRFILLALALITAAGIASGWKMPVALFPQVHFPRIVVEIESSDRPVERMALEVTTPVEEALRSLPGVANVRSVTSRGESEISVSFSWDQDMDSALFRAQAAVNQLTPQLPAGSDVSVRRMDPTVFPCLACSVTTGVLSMAQLRQATLTRIRPMLASVPGVARVEIQGGAVDELHVVIDPMRLHEHGVSVEQMVDAISGASVQASIGRLEDHGSLYLIVLESEAGTTQTLSSIPVRSGKDGILRLGDLARIVPGSAPQLTRTVADGSQAVSLQIYQEDGGNTVAIAQEIRNRLTGLHDRLAPDIALSIWYDQSQLITDSMVSVRDALAIGIALAAIVLLVTLRSWRITLVALICVPASLATTMLAMSALHLDFNIMTLGGMAAAVGLIIDDAIVMVEQAVAQARRQHVYDRQALIGLGLRFAGPLAGSSLATLVIFIPLVFLSGVTGAFFKALAMTMAISLMASFAISLLVVPLVTALILSRSDIDHDDHSRLGEAISGWYRVLMAALLKRPFLVVLGILPIVLLGWHAFTQVGTGFMPNMDEGGFVIDYRAQPGTALSECNRLVLQIERLLRSTPEVLTWSRRTGAQLGNGLTEANEGDFFVRLKPFPRRSCAAVMDGLRSRIDRQVAGLDIDMAQLMEDLIGDLVADPHPIEVIVAGDDATRLIGTAKAIAAKLSSIRGVVDINDGVVVAGDTLSIVVDRDLAAHEDIDPADISRQLQTLIGGSIAATVQQGSQLKSIRVWLPERTRSSREALSRLELHAGDGHSFLLERIARIDTAPGQLQIDHNDLQRVIAVTANISGRDLGSTVGDVQSVLRAGNLVPNDMSYSLGGLYQQQRIAFRSLSAVLASAVLLVFVLLVFLYQSMRMAVAMVLTSLLSLCGVFIGLHACGLQLNISSMMGMTMVVGIVTEVSILLVSAYVHHREIPSPQERLIQAGSSRLRPIVMTIVAATLALLPLSMGFGAGADMQRPLAVAIISGLLLQLPLVTIVLPLLLFWMRVP